MPKKCSSETLKKLRTLQEPANLSILQRITGVKDKKVAYKILKEKINASSKGKYISKSIKELILKKSKIKVSDCHKKDNMKNPRLVQIQNNFKRFCHKPKKNRRRRRKYQIMISKKKTQTSILQGKRIIYFPRSTFQDKK